jgi:hypothetical protein
MSWQVLTAPNRHLLQPRGVYIVVSLIYIHPLLQPRLQLLRICTPTLADTTQCRKSVCTQAVALAFESLRPFQQSLIFTMHSNACSWPGAVNPGCTWQGIHTTSGTNQVAKTPLYAPPYNSLTCNQCCFAHLAPPRCSTLYWLSQSQPPEPSHCACQAQHGAGHAAPQTDTAT